MSSAAIGHITDEAYAAQQDRIAARPDMREGNITLPGSVTTKLTGAFGAIGAVGILLTIVGAFALNTKHALAAYEVGLFTATAMSLGCLAMVMIFHAMKAGWTSGIRRVFENGMILLPFCWLGLGVVVILELLGPGREGSGVLLTWLYTEKQGTFLIEHKSGFLNPVFFVVKFLLYGGVWSFLSIRLYDLSRKQDATGDRWLTSKMRRLSCGGLVLFALSTAFFAFDFAMAQDYRFFSTMWGVYFFAISALAGISLVALTLSLLRFFGRLNGVVTEEHFHDLGKLVFAFTCFWAYIAFSQYFLIWYSNIPEETAWYTFRQQNGWMPLFTVLTVMHFAVPFVLFVSRIPKRSTIGLAFMSLWMLVLTVFDLVWVIRPMVYAPVGGELTNPGAAGWWLDVAAVLGVLGVFGALFVRKLAAGPLICTKDPMLVEALSHKNYV